MTSGSHPEWGQIHGDGPGWPRAARGHTETPPGERSQVPHRRDPDSEARPNVEADPVQATGRGS